MYEACTAAGLGGFEGSSSSVNGTNCMAQTVP